MLVCLCAFDNSHCFCTFIESFESNRGARFPIWLDKIYTQAHNRILASHCYHKSNSQNLIYMYTLKCVSTHSNRSNLYIYFSRFLSSCKLLRSWYSPNICCVYLLLFVIVVMAIAAAALSSSPFFFLCASRFGCSCCYCLLLYVRSIPTLFELFALASSLYLFSF